MALPRNVLGVTSQELQALGPTLPRYIGSLKPVHPSSNAQDLLLYVIVQLHLGNGGDEHNCMCSAPLTEGLLWSVVYYIYIRNKIIYNYIQILGKNSCLCCA